MTPPHTHTKYTTGYTDTHSREKPWRAGKGKERDRPREEAGNLQQGRSVVHKDLSPGPLGLRDKSERKAWSW